MITSNDPVEGKFRIGQQVEILRNGLVATVVNVRGQKVQVMPWGCGYTWWFRHEQLRPYARPAIVI